VEVEFRNGVGKMMWLVLNGIEGSGGLMQGVGGGKEWVEEQ